MATLAASAMIAALGGTAAVIAVQARANADLRRSSDRVQDRFDLARGAIRAFQDGVNEDEMLKGENLKPLRDKLLRKAAGFYLKLEGLLQDQTDRPSRAILAQSYHELAGLTDKIGIRTEALAIYRKALVIRRELATGGDADADAKIELARTLNEIGGMAKATGDNPGALLAPRKWPRDITTPLAAGTDGSDEARDLLAHSYQGLESVLIESGNSADATEARRESLKIWTMLANDNPRVGKYRSNLRGMPPRHRHPAGTVRSGRRGDEDVSGGLGYP